MCTLLRFKYFMLYKANNISIYNNTFDGHWTFLLEETLYDFPEEIPGPE